MGEIRHGRFTDLDAATVFGLARLRQEVFVVEQECAYPDLDDRDTDPETVHFWIGGENGIVACLRLLRDGAGWKIGRVCCAKAERGRGLSARLMAAAIGRAGPETTFALDAQTYAAGFYRRFGFVEDGPEFIEDGIAHVPMIRKGR
ncbi:GNAT family N-acetyltransferase [Glycomyces sp. L485]|uniref:GNAT family N-acetyltransferase n=1 Tax=Glycomyces sp. L485 TaxID=2909235 RepID=UPI001F4A54B0|nr:GNAT family N-acetyltransferase [Glycomyces sp. L485]MCH7230973.1 GNAT family N-acetyltransferase [Glycomyces sp. L485]